jgi:hypothetical protein
VFSITSQRGGKITKSQFAVPGVSLGEVSTVKIDGSGWSKLIEPIVMKRAVSYFSGASVPCQATTLNGLAAAGACHRAPPNFFTISQPPALSSKAATDARKSRAFARPLLPIGVQLGQAERRTVVLAHVATRGAIDRHLEHQTAR